jgi:lysophospholipase L1-like esterase
MRLPIGVVIFLLAACGGSETKPVETTGTIVFIGDSITQLWPLDRYLTGAINVGVSGNETSQMLARFDQDVLARNPALIVIDGGINDIRNRDSGDSVNILEMVQRARAANIKVVVGTVMLCNALGSNSAARTQLILGMDDDIRAASSAYGFTVVDYYRATLNKAGSLDRHLFGDGLHPNRRGYDAMWRELLPVLRAQGLIAE